MNTFGPIIEALPELIRRFRTQGFLIGMNEQLAINDWLVAVSIQHRDVNHNEVRAAINSIISTNEIEQKLFNELFHSWWLELTAEDTNLERENELSLQERVFPKEDFQLSTDYKRWLYLSCFFLACLILTAVLLNSSPDILDEKPEQNLPISSSIDIINEPTISDENLTIIPPNPITEPVKPNNEDYSKFAKWLPNLWVIPLIFWLCYFLNCLFQKDFALKKRPNRWNEDFRLDNLRLSGKQPAQFSSAQLAPVWRYFHRFRKSSSKTLDIPKTITKTIHNLGMMVPCYKERYESPSYIILIEQLNSEDHIAALGYEMAARMREHGIEIASYHFYKDPRYCRPSGRNEISQSPDALAKIYSDTGLLVLCDIHLVKDPMNHHMSEWAKRAFSKWLTDPVTAEIPDRGLERIWLSPNVITGSDEYSIKQVLPEFKHVLLSSQTLRNMIKGKNFELQHPLNDSHVPILFSSDPERWIDISPPPKRLRRRALTQLKHYLNGDGYLLLCSIAAYPGIYWRLTLALDQQLNCAEDSELRLRKLARLPWCRYASMPNYIRRDLLRTLTSDERMKVSEAFQQLLIADKTQLLNLPVHQSVSKNLWKVIKNVRQVANLGHPITDSVFADILRGRRPGLLEFKLPAMLTGWDTPSWRGLGWPLLLGVFGIPFTIFINSVWWQSNGLSNVELSALTIMQTRNSQIRIEIQSDPLLGEYADVLKNVLQNWGFENIDLIRSLPVVFSANEDLISQQDNTIQYAQGQQQFAQTIAGRLSWINYGKAPSLERSEEIELGLVRVKIHAKPNVFRDAFNRGDSGKFDFPVPKMVVIPSGEFEMGSSETETGRATDEGPVHLANINSFAIGRNEITFEEYTAFAQDTNRVVPDDSGWGRGNQPVINVSWEDAQAYIRWLSSKTGKRFRLPSETEWEYVARAGTDTRYWWGNEVEPNRANCYGCDTVWGGISTAPVGTFPANAFGVYDTVGNVWEWVEDCWHTNYTEAPGDGQAWLESNGGDCNLRVVRGGSWLDDPDRVRSAFRFFNIHSDAIINLGFRIAEDLD